MGDVTRLTPVLAAIMIEHDDELPVALDDATARRDDAFWARYVKAPVTPRRFVRWWIARRWVIPRDPRKE